MSGNKWDWTALKLKCYPRVIRTTRRERQEEVPLASFDSFPPVECDLKYSRERERD